VARRESPSALLERSGELQPLLGRRIEQRELAGVEGEMDLPDKPRSRRRSAGVSGDGPYTASTTCNLASIRNWSSTSTTAPEDARQVSIGHAHTGQSGTLVGIAVISLAGNSKVARRSAQKEIFAGPRLALLFSTTERSCQSAA
jgi:hypothetical protein